MDAPLKPIQATEAQTKLSIFFQKISRKTDNELLTCIRFPPTIEIEQQNLDSEVLNRCLESLTQSLKEKGFALERFKISTINEKTTYTLGIARLEHN